MKSEHTSEGKRKATAVKRQPSYRHCFVCGVENPIGLKVAFYHDAEKVWTEFTPRPEHQGYPGIMHGGILYTLLDETVGRAAFLRDMWVMTARMQVSYRHPVPIGSTLRVEGEISSIRGRVMEAVGRARLPDGTIAAEATGTFMTLPPGMRSEVELALSLHEVNLENEQPATGESAYE